MDQIKIGKFIADRRKNAGLTQLELAEKMGITDRAVSKWERGLGRALILYSKCDRITVKTGKTGYTTKKGKYGDRK